MFTRVISYKGFWRSVAALTVFFIVIFVPIQWAFNGFQADYFSSRNLLKFAFVNLLAGFIYGFAFTYGKFWQKLKEEDYRNES